MGIAPYEPVANGESVLIVEDEFIIGTNIGTIVGKLGYKVLGIVSSGLEALEIAAREDIDLALMDIRIQGEMDGIETAERLGRDHRVPVVYLSAFSDDRTLARARATGPFGYITKPVTESGIKVAVAVALEQGRLQQLRREREGTLHRVLEELTEGVLLTDIEGRITFMNSAAQEIAGVGLEAGHGRKLDDVFQVVSDSGAILSLERLVTKNGCGEALATATGMVMGDDGSERRIMLSATGLRAREGAAGGIILISEMAAVIRLLSDSNKKLTLLTDSLANDVGEPLNLLSQRLLDSNKKLTLLTHSLVHDIREPLNSVSVHLGMLNEEAKITLEPKSQEYLDGISGSLKRLRGLVETVTEYVETMTLDVEKPPVIVRAEDALNESMLNLQAAISRSNARIKAVALPAVLAHRTALTLIFQNLLGNAIKYSTDGDPKVEVSAVRDGDFWRFLVADHGPGFKPDQAERIFEPFKRAHGYEIEGSGLGLAICRQLVEQQNGRIWAESKPGEGARFYFTIPTIDSALRARVQPLM